VDEFLTVDEVAKTLKVNQQTVRNWIDRGQLPAVRVGARRVRVRRSALDEFLAAGEMAGEAPDVGDRRPEHTESAEAWSRLGEALADSTAALADEDVRTLSQALESLADAAARLADALPAERAKT
jgi:excisionase family DNA binding protein